MSFLIIGHIRSGSTLLYELLRKCLVHQNIITEESAIGEFLLESPEIEIGESEGKLWCTEKPLPRDLFKSLVSFAVPFEYRASLLKKHIHEGYFFKSIGIELLRDEELLRGVQKHYDNVIFIRRRNILESVISSLLAFEYGYFRNNKEPPEYRPFIANLNMAKWSLNTVLTQIKLIAILHKNTKSILTFEDMIKESPYSTVEKCGISAPNDLQLEFPKELKMSYPCVRKELIINLDEIKQLVFQFEERYIVSKQSCYR